MISDARVGRRLLFAAGLTALTGSTVGCTVGSDPSDPPRERARCVPATTLSRVDRLGDARLIYEENRRATTFRIDPDFHDRLATWHTWWNENSGLSPADRIGCYGTWVDGGGDCDSWHNSGRAFDLTRLDRGGQTQINLRYDQIEGDSRALTDYWRVAASLHRHFAYVLTYLFDDLHRNHIHIDNSRSGQTDSTFSSRSRVQVQAVQAVSRHVWGLDIPITGEWDSTTEDASAEVLKRLGSRGDVTTGQKQWHLFLTGSVRRS